MKNEPGHRADKIVEILAESLRRQDKLVEEFKEMHKGIQSVGNDVQEMRGDIQEMKGNINRTVIAVDTLADVVKIAIDGVKDMSSIKQRIARLERHTGLE